MAVVWVKTKSADGLSDVLSAWEVEGSGTSPDPYRRVDASRLTDAVRGRPVRVSADGMMPGPEVHRLLGGAFPSTTVDPSVWTAVATGAAGVAGANGSSAAAVGGVLTLEPGTAAAGIARLASNRRGRYLNDFPCLFRMRLSVPSLAAVSGKRRWGVGLAATPTAISDSPTNGAYFYQSSAGVFGVGVVKGGSATEVAQTAFSRGAYTLDANYHSFGIEYDLGEVSFFVDDALVHVHEITTSPWTEDPHLRAFADCVNSGAVGAGANTLRLINASLYVLGPEHGRPKGTHYEAATAGAQIRTRPGQLFGVVIGKKASAAGLLTLYDTATGSTSTTNKITEFDLQNPIQPSPFGPAGISFDHGLYVVITGTGFDVTVLHD